MTAHRLTSLAVGAAVLAAVLVLAMPGGGPDDSGSEGWVLGLLLIFGPLLAAAATWSVAGSTLLRPVGGIAAALCTLVSAVHVAVALDEQGAMGWAYAAPAIATPALVIGAVVRGPSRRPGRGEVTSDAGRSASGALDTASAATDGVEGPPLDVITPLRDARSHATKVVMAWLAVLVIAALVSVPLFRLLGWPIVVAKLDARVADLREVAGRTTVSFEARDNGRTVRWTQVWEETEWEVGDRRVAYLDDEGKVHWDQQFNLAGVPLFMPFLLVGMFAALAVRRWWGLVVASWDVRNGNDKPRLRYAAVIDDPAPRTRRPLLAVWEHDPTRQPRLAKPDAVYRADDETGEDQQSAASHVVVRRAWIDTGMWPGSKPRWAGFEHGVAVPHRRSLLGRWYVRVVTRRAAVAPLVDLHHGPPDPTVQPPESVSQSGWRTIAGMAGWRLLAVVAGVALAFVGSDGGRSAEIQNISPQRLRGVEAHVEASFDPATLPHGSRGVIPTAELSQDL